MKLSVHDAMHAACVHMRPGMQNISLTMSHDEASVSRMQNPSSASGISQTAC